MHAVPSFRTILFAAGLALLATGPRAWAQSTPDAIARKAYSAHYDRAYIIGGFALPNYTNLNKRLEEGSYPTLRPGALMFGAGYGQGFGPYGLALEWRLTARANDIDSVLTFSNLLTNTFALMGRYNVLVADRYTVAVLLGPTYSRLNLTLKKNPINRRVPTTFASQLIETGNKRKLYESQFGLSAGLQLDRHFSWLRRNDVQACGRSRQITVVLRFTYDYVL